MVKTVSVPTTTARERGRMYGGGLSLYLGESWCFWRLLGGVLVIVCLELDDLWLM